ncbi:MAG: GNAT family N-acetyltransferase [Pseudomonadota bacterium]
MTHESALRRARWLQDAEILQDLRAEVFIEEQGVPREIEWDGRDAEAEHVLAERDGEAVGCGRLLPDGRIGRLAVRQPFRDQGIGAQILDELLGIARRRGERAVYLHAQADALTFYERAGFTARGERFEEAGIEHVDMVMDFSYEDWDSTVFGVRYPSPLDELVVAQARLARRELAILSPDLDTRLFNRAGFISALRRLARSERQARIRVLITDVRAVVGRRHGILDLARRMPSKLELRSLREHPNWDGDTLVIRDRDSTLGMPGSSRDPGFYRPGDRARCETALGRFEELWKAGNVDVEFRALAL